MKQVRLFCPATVANVSCGFDVLGFCLENVGDIMTLRLTETPGVRMGKLAGHPTPVETENNVAAVAVKALLEDRGEKRGIEIDINKIIKPGSGIGSSAASASGAVYGANLLLGKPYRRKELVYFAMVGEKVASGALHADNVAPAMLGGFTLIRGYNPLDIIKIEAPKLLRATILHPQIEIKTAMARGLVEPQVDLNQAITQCGNLGGLISGLYTRDYNLIGRSLVDVIAEPYRSKLIPHYQVLKEAAIKAGALGFGISGSGPSVFALSKGEKIAKKIGKELEKIYTGRGIDYNLHFSGINTKGIKKIA